jgi:hypothetical protein
MVRRIRRRWFRLLIAAILCLGLIPSFILGCSNAGQRSAFEGLWEGELAYPGLTVRIALRIANGSQPVVALLRPDQSSEEILASEVDFMDTGLLALFDAIDVKFEGELIENGTCMQGRWSDTVRTLELVLKRVDEIQTATRPQTPIPPFPYEIDDVYIDHEMSEVQLAGTLFLPEGTSEVPGVVLVSGAGGQDRDSTILGHRPFLVIADYLARQGIAVLRYDDRGVGGSTGDRSQATSQDYAEDALLALTWLLKQPRVDGSRVGIVGHSEGGTIASLAALESENVAFVVMLASPGLHGFEYNIQFEERMARMQGLKDEEISARLSFQRKILETLVGEIDPDKARDRITEMYMSLPGISDEQVEAALNRLLSPWFLFSLNYDPGETLLRVECPILAVFGELDWQVPPQGNIEAVRSSIITSGNAHSRVVLLPGLNHLFQKAQTGSPMEYGDIEETVDESVLELMCEWIFSVGLTP